MMDDLDELRAVLRERADLAPNPDNLIPVTRKLARCRQMRRRGLGLGGAMVLTALALVSTALLGGTRPAPPTPPMPAGGPLVTPMFPFSVGTLPEMLRLEQTGWASTGGDPTTRAFSSYSMDFGGSIGPITNRVTIQWLYHEPLVKLGPDDSQHPATWHGVTGSTAWRQDQAGQHWDAIWPVGAHAWIQVTTTSVGPGWLGLPGVADIVNAVTTTASTPLTTLQIPHLPAGYTVFSWRQTLLPGRVGPVQDDIELCPRPIKSTRAQACFEVLAAPGDFAYARTSSGRAVTRGRQVDATHWVGVYPAQVPGIQPAELNGLLAEASVG